jgi:hypothetical protein
MTEAITEAELAGALHFMSYADICAATAASTYKRYADWCMSRPLVKIGVASS